jgi:hypothetical protein
MRQSQALPRGTSRKCFGEVLPLSPDLIVAAVLTAIWLDASEEELQASADKLHSALCEQLGEDGVQIQVGAVWSNAGAYIQ